MICNHCFCPMSMWKNCFYYLIGTFTTILFIAFIDYVHSLYHQYFRIAIVYKMQLCNVGYAKPKKRNIFDFKGKLYVSVQLPKIRSLCNQQSILREPPNKNHQTNSNSILQKVPVQTVIKRQRILNSWFY